LETNSLEKLRKLEAQIEKGVARAGIHGHSADRGQRRNLAHGSVVPPGFNAASANVTWNGTFGTNTPGVTMQWQWGVAVLHDRLQCIAPLPGHGNSCVGGGDHAGTPEGTSPTTGRLLKQCVIGGATGGGGSNWTGSWSGTANVTPVCH
jgi:hypothetical protein